MLKIGFTGTQNGMTPVQADVVKAIIQDHHGDVFEFHHGDCIGADAQAHDIAAALGARIILHPPSNPSKRAFKKGCTEERPPKDYLDRNQDIVSETLFLIAAPKERTEQKKGGTWFTVRFARKLRKPIYLVEPDGTVNESHW